jgi:hypothetical protein
VSVRLAIGAAGVLAGLAALGRRGSRAGRDVFVRGAGPGHPSRQEPASGVIGAGICGEDVDLYHITFVEKLPTILAHGLRNMRRWSEGRLFFSAGVDALDFWLDIVRDSDSGLNSAWHPVIIRVPESYVMAELHDDLYIDDHGEEQACTVFTYRSIPSSVLQVDVAGPPPGPWGVSGWRPDWRPLTSAPIKTIVNRLSRDGARPLNPFLAPRVRQRVSTAAKAKEQLQGHRKRLQGVREAFPEWAEEVSDLGDQGKRDLAATISGMKPLSYKQGEDWIVEYTDFQSLIDL